MISSYPPQGQVHGKGTVGVASYAKNTILAVGRNKDLKVVVLAEKLAGEKEVYQEGNVEIRRCWRRNKMSSFRQILEQVSKTKTKKVLVEFEMAMFGKPAFNVFFPLLLVGLRLMGKEICVVVHQVVLDFSKMSGHLGEEKKSLKVGVMSLLGLLFFRIILKLSNKVIVFEDFLKERLAGVGNSNKVWVVAHGVEKKKGLFDKNNLRKKLGLSKDDFVLTTFGFVAWYKGTDWLVETVVKKLDQNFDKKLKLIVAGGGNPNHKDKEFYKDYLEKIKEQVKKYPDNIRMTGFIKEGDIDSYYQASDVMVLPYRVGMSSSGPLSIAFTNKRPFLVSRPAAEALESGDIKEVFEKNKTEIENAVFDLEGESFWDQVNKLKKKTGGLSAVSGEIAKVRGWDNIGKRYLEVLGF